jgi:ribosomal protein S4
MFRTKKTRFKPIFKQLIKLRENVQNNTKLLKFKRKKWEAFIEQYLKKLKRYKKFKPHDQTRYTISKYASKGNAHKKQFRNTLNSSRNFRLLYGGLSKKELKNYIKHLKKNKIKKSSNINLLFLKLFETRLDTVLFRAKFSKSCRDSRQLITHRKVLVNNKVIESPAYQLKSGDLISIKYNQQYIIVENFRYCLENWVTHKTKLWPLPPKHLLINYNTMEIFFENIDTVNLAADFLFNLNLEKVILNYYRH